MSHPEQLVFIESISRLYDAGWRSKKILEIGSYDVNGVIRSLFGECESYVGVDLTAGPGVDVIASGHEVAYEDRIFDLTISCECFEHNPYWLETFENMIRMTKPGGLTVFTCASRGRLEHGTIRTGDGMSPGTTAVGINYYRNLRQSDFTRNMNLNKMFVDYRFFYMVYARDLYFVGVKRGGTGPRIDLSSVAKDISRIRKSSHARTVSLRNYYNLVSEKAVIEVLSRVLPESQFQNAALSYLRTKMRLQQTIRQKILRNTNPSNV
jgi:SAM-dependent methyltransferase